MLLAVRMPIAAIQVAFKIGDQSIGALRGSSVSPHSAR